MEFIIPLAITLIVGTVLILLVVSLVLAPWPILLFLLMFGLIGTRRFIQSNVLQSMPQEVEALSQAESVAAPGLNQERILIYRGARYQQPSLISETAVEVSQIEISGKYRGGVWKSTQRLFVKRD